MKSNLSATKSLLKWQIGLTARIEYNIIILAKTEISLKFFPMLYDLVFTCFAAVEKLYRTFLYLSFK